MGGVFTFSLLHTAEKIRLRRVDHVLGQSVKCRFYNRSELKCATRLIPDASVSAQFPGNASSENGQSAVTSAKYFLIVMGTFFTKESEQWIILPAGQIHSVSDTFCHSGGDL